MQKNKGFTLLEAMIVLALIGLLAAFAVPNLLDWRKDANLRGSTNNLLGDLQMAKIRAIKESNSVVIEFSTADNAYRIFVDNGEGTSGIQGDKVKNGDEPVVKQASLSPGVSFKDITWSGDHVSFSSRGRASNGSVKLINTAGSMRQIGTSNTGKIEVKKLT